MEDFVNSCSLQNPAEHVLNRLKARWRTLRNRRYVEVYKESNAEIRFYVNDSQFRILANEAHRKNMTVSQLSKRTVLDTLEMKTTSHNKGGMDVLLRKTLTVLTQARKQTQGVTQELVLQQIQAIQAELNEVA